jgi:hypothetical protein
VIGFLNLQGVALDAPLDETIFFACPDIAIFMYGHQACNTLVGAKTKTLDSHRVSPQSYINGAVKFPSTLPLVSHGWPLPHEEVQAITSYRDGRKALLHWFTSSDGSGAKL